MRKIKLTQGKYALVDDDKYEYLNQWKWNYHITNRDKTGYAVRLTSRKNPPRKTIRMHRVVLNYFGPLFVDHINRNGIDNRRSNLRLATKNQSIYNKSYSCNNKNKAKGVTQVKDKHGAPKYWIARVTESGKRHYLGVFKSKRSALIAYNKAAKRLHGEFYYGGK
jgi:hypothetical protein